MPYEQLEHAVPTPRAGVSHRRWQRFERELEAWLVTPPGRFAVYRAQREIDAPPAERRDAAPAVRP